MWEKYWLETALFFFEASYITIRNWFYLTKENKRKRLFDQKKENSTRKADLRFSIDFVLADTRGAGVGSRAHACAAVGGTTSKEGVVVCELGIERAVGSRSESIDAGVDGAGSRGLGGRGGKGVCVGAEVSQRVVLERDSARCAGGGGRVEESVVSRNSVVVPVKERIHIRCDQNSKNHT